MEQRAEREDRERMRREIEKEKFVVKKKRWSILFININHIIKL